MGIVDKQQQIQALKAAVDKRNSDNRFFPIYNCTNLKPYCFRATKVLNIISQTTLPKKQPPSSHLTTPRRTLIPPQKELLPKDSWP